MPKVFFVDRFIDYSTKLFEAIQQVAPEKKDFDILFLGPDDKKPILFSNQILPNSKKVWSSNNYVWKLFKYITKNKPDLVHFTFELRTFGTPWSSFKFPFLLLLLRLKKQKVIVSLFNIWFYRENKEWKLPSYFPLRLPRLILTILIKTFFYTICKLCDKIIVGTKEGKLCLVDYYNIDEEKIKVVYFGISPQTNSTNVKARYKYEKLFRNKKIILYFGVLSPRKNHQYVIKAFKNITHNLPNHILVIAGTATKEFEDYENQLRNMVDTLQLNEKVFFTGFVNNDEVDVLFDIAESVLFLYSPMSDSTYTVTLAIQHHKPIIASNIEIFREIFSDDHAILVDFKNLRQLSETIFKVCTEIKIREDLSYKMNDLIKKLTWENAAKEYIDTYEKLT